MPKTIYPESYSSMASAKLNSLILSKLREFALILRDQSKLKSVASLRKLKCEMMSQIYTTLSITLGAPPRPDESFKWEYYDTDGKFHSWSGTARQFYDAFAKRKGMNPNDSFSLINDPRNKYEHLYTVERLGNVWGGKPVRYVNAPVEALEDAVIAGIKANTPMFFGCDSGKNADRNTGVWDTELYDLKLAYGWSLDSNKTQRLESGDSSMTHAMVITAVHLDDAGRPLKYKIENSWSDTAGEKVGLRRRLRSPSGLVHDDCFVVPRIRLPSRHSSQPCRQEVDGCAGRWQRHCAQAMGPDGRPASNGRADAQGALA